MAETLFVDRQDFFHVLFENLHSHFDCLQMWNKLKEKVPVFDKWPLGTYLTKEGTNPRIFLSQEELESGIRSFFSEHLNEDIGYFMYAQVPSETNK